MTASTFLLVVAIAVGAELFAVWLARKSQCCKEQTALLVQIAATDQTILATNKLILAALSGQKNPATALKLTFGQPINQ